MVFWGKIRVDKTKLDKNNNDLISILFNLSCELGPIMTRYDFLWAR